jgi:hypothetical protein
MLIRSSQRDGDRESRVPTVHTIDVISERMLRCVLAYMENRLRLDPVPLDSGSWDPKLLDTIFGGGLLGPDGYDPHYVLGVYASAVAPTVMGADSPRSRRVHTAWADDLLDRQAAFVPPTRWLGETVPRFAFLHPQTPMDVVRGVLGTMA